MFCNYICAMLPINLVKWTFQMRSNLWVNTQYGNHLALSYWLSNAPNGNDPFITEPRILVPLVFSREITLSTPDFVWMGRVEVDLIFNLNVDLFGEELMIISRLNLFSCYVCDRYRCFISWKLCLCVQAHCLLSA